MRILLRIGATLLVAAPAFAQEARTRIPSASERDMALILARIGSCMVRTRPEVVRRWFKHIPGTKAEEDFVFTQEGTLTVCMERGDSRVVTYGRLDYDPSELRSYVAHSAAAAAAADAPAKLPVDPSVKPWFSDGLGALGKEAVFDKSAIVQQDFGHCVVVANWAGSREFLRSVTGSKKETAAIASLLTSIGPCLPTGEQFRITKAMLRRSLSEPFFHLATMKRPSPVGNSR